MKTVLTIAGSDCSGGAGIQADIKTIMAHGLYAMSVITAVTAQNTMGVYAVDKVTKDMVEKQAECVFSDIFPDAVKIGMISDEEQMEAVACVLNKYKAKNVVIDPVMISTSGRRLMQEEAIEYLKRELFPKATLVTPNIPEAKALSGIDIKTKEDMIKAGRVISEMSGSMAVLVKGGHFTDLDLDVSDDLLVMGNETVWYESKRIDNDNTHGTGCTLSSAIACGLAQGHSLKESISSAKEYITGALKDGLNLGKGNGPLNHAYRITL